MRRFKVRLRKPLGTRPTRPHLLEKRGRITRAPGRKRGFWRLLTITARFFCFLLPAAALLIFLAKDSLNPSPAEVSVAVAARSGNSGKLYRVNEQGIKYSGAADISLMVKADVISHVDGDTVKVRIHNPPTGIDEKETIRLLGVNAPETKHPSKPVEYFGREASEFTRGALLNKQVYLAFDWDLRDQYGRLLAYIYTSQGQCFNARLISEGYARAYTYFAFQFMDEFRGLDQQARKEKRGLWAE